ncbi:MAG: Kazal-type serine protease inhibitor domain-containing protein [Polyangiaceae bacterium]
MRNTSISVLSIVLAAGAALCACTPSTPPAATVTPAPVSTASASAAPNPAPSAPAPSKAGPAGAMCGGIAGFGCATGLYCSFPIEAHCGAADQAGVCKAVPQMCTEQYDPVCGCNDKTYPNECAAAREGIAVGKKGECTAPPSEAPAPVLAEGQLCGTRGVNGECGPGLFCKWKPDCGTTDAGGSCARKTTVCTKIYKPVCGCNGKTYGNACSAAGEGMSIVHDGPCKP